MDRVHITGSERTHDTIVFGPGEAGQEAKAAGRPRLVKPIRSELGGASPTIVVPGPWSEADIAYQAQHLATQKLYSAGHTCVASQVLILPEGWHRKEQLLDALRSALAGAPDRAPFYPGTQERQDAFRAANPDAEAIPARSSAPCSSTGPRQRPPGVRRRDVRTRLPHHGDRRC